jgi:hypothetical protein
VLAGIRCEEEGRGEAGRGGQGRGAAQRAAGGEERRGAVWRGALWRGMGSTVCSGAGFGRVARGEGRRGEARGGGVRRRRGACAGWARTGVGGAAPALPVAPAGEGGSEGVAWQRRISMPGAKQASIVLHQNWWVWVEGSLVL